MPINAQEYLAAFRRGEDFQVPAIGVIVNGQPDDSALQLLGQELAVADPNVRENIVRLLVDMGRRTDPLTPKGADVLRHPADYWLLPAPDWPNRISGGRRPWTPRRLATQSDLARFGDGFTKALEDGPTEEAFLLVAKAKPKRAQELVDRLARSPRWNELEAAKIARAALGAKGVEDDFLAAADAATDGKASRPRARPARPDRYSRSLRAIAERLRTPLTIDMPGAFEKSVRLNVLKALLYNYPDQPVLYPNNIITEADYTAARALLYQGTGGDL